MNLFAPTQAHTKKQGAQPMKIYISGPITGKPDKNEHAFRYAERHLQFLKYDALVPLDIPSKEDTWLSYMKSDIKAMMDCDGVYMLRGWRRSRGARIELLIAWLLHYKIMFEMRQPTNFS